MSDAEMSRVKGDLAVIQRALGLHFSFGKETLVFGTFLALAAVSSSVLSLLVESSWFQVIPFAVIMTLCLIGLHLRSRRTDLSHEIKLQVVLSITIYFALFAATCGYTLATFVGPSIGLARTASLYAASLVYIFGFLVVLVVNALKSRERYYCLGLAISLLLTGLLIPILDQHYSFPFAHAFMAVGFLSGVMIQWVQLRKAGPVHAAD